jgi:hypothetical protein
MFKRLVRRRINERVLKLGDECDQAGLIVSGVIWRHGGYLRSSLVWFEIGEQIVEQIVEQLADR